MDRLQTTGLTNGPVTSDVATSKLVRLDLATFFSECQISAFGGQRVATESPTECEPTGLVCVCLRSIVNIPLQ